jgi:hypothetical protein
MGEQKHFWADLDHILGLEVDDLSLDHLILQSHVSASLLDL